MTEPQQTDFTNPMVAERILLWSEYTQMVEVLRGLMDNLTSHIKEAAQQAILEVSQARMTAYNELAADRDRHKESLHLCANMEAQRLRTYLDTELTSVTAYLKGLSETMGNKPDDKATNQPR